MDKEKREQLVAELLRRQHEIFSSDPMPPPLDLAPEPLDWMDPQMKELLVAKLPKDELTKLDVSYHMNMAGRRLMGRIIGEAIRKALAEPGPDRS